jgi:hypothetical protein
MFILGGCILFIVFILLLLPLLPLLPPLPLINRIGIVCKANQFVFVYYVSTSIKTTLLTELVL